MHCHTGTCVTFQGHVDIKHNQSFAVDVNKELDNVNMI